MLYLANSIPVSYNHFSSWFEQGERNMRIALFDWNGTLFNDIPIWYESIEKTFNAFGKQPPTIAEYFRELEGDYLAIYRSRGIQASRDELNAIYEPSYESLVGRATLFSHVERTLKLLSGKGITLGVITMQKDFLVSPLLDKFNLKSFFRHRVFHVLDKKTAIQRILEEERIKPQNCCYIGDAPSDIRQGKKVGVTTIAFLNGYIPEDLIIATNPNFAIRNLEKLTVLI